MHVFAAVLWSIGICAFLLIVLCVSVSDASKKQAHYKVTVTQRRNGRTTQEWKRIR